MFPACCFSQRTCVAQGLLMGYSMRLKLTQVSSIYNLWLDKLVYVGVVVPLSWMCLHIYVCVSYLFKWHIDP